MCVVPAGATGVSHIPSPSPSRGDEHTECDLRDVQRLEALKHELEDLIKNDPVLQEFSPKLLLDMTPDGLRVQIIDKQNRPMFATGSAQVQSYMRKIGRAHV